MTYHGLPWIYKFIIPEIPWHHINQSALFNQTQTCLGNMGFDSKSLRRMGWFQVAQGAGVNGLMMNLEHPHLWESGPAPGPPTNATHTNPTVKELALWSGGYYSLDIQTPPEKVFGPQKHT